MSLLTEREGALWLDRVCCVPVIHGRSTFAMETRRLFLSRRFTRIAIELPASLESAILESVGVLPHVTSVVYREESGDRVHVTADPCDAIIEAIRLAIPERLPCEFIDAEVRTIETQDLILPDDWALHQIGLPDYYRAVEPYLPQPSEADDARERHMAHELRRLNEAGGETLFLCGLSHLRGIVHHWEQKTPPPEAELPSFDVQIYSVHPDSLYFVLGEMPYSTYRYEWRRSQLGVDAFEKIDAIKELLIATREQYVQEHKDEVDQVPPGSLQTLIRYARNLTVGRGRFTASLYDLVVAARGVVGSEFGVTLLELAKYYPYLDPLTPYPTLETDGKVFRSGDEQAELKPRFPGLAKEWKRLRLEKKPKREDAQKWKTYWDPYRSCSWPPEDDVIEGFAAHVRRKTLQAMRQNLANTEEFLTSFKDGLDLRETLRQFHTGKIYVREEPVVRGRVGSVVMIFEEDRNDSRFPWRCTWQAEHKNESTLGFYATDFRDNMIGPGIGRSEYGGVMFLYPPQPIDEIWEDPRFNQARDSMERLVLAAILHSREPVISYVAAKKPTPWMLEKARRMGRHLSYLPLSSFNPSTLRKLRRFHVLNGHQVRSWAAKFIR